MHEPRQTGFTLIELMVVVTIIAVLAAISVPNLLSAKASGNESSAISTLRNLASAQVATTNRRFIDADADGRGEYGFFGELSGGVPARNVAGATLLPPLLSAAFQSVNLGQVTKSGYVFAIFLPDAVGAGLEELPANYGNVDSDNAEIAWCAYAWPSDLGSSGKRVFFINQQGEILFADNNANNYSGLVAPAFDAAFGVAGSMMGAYTPGVAAADGEIWRVLQ